MKFHILTIFPDSVEEYLSKSLLGKAQDKGLIEVNIVDFRKYATDKHQTVDDSPYGGGPGMVMMVEPIYKAVKEIKDNTSSQVRTVLFSTRGDIFNQEKAKDFTEYDELILICGRYEGVDERVAEHIADEEISIGDFVLQGGELPALVLTEAVSRHVPGVLGKTDSLEEIKGSYPVYTRPQTFKLGGDKAWEVPEILLSGDHKKIEKWREKHGSS